MAIIYVRENQLAYRASRDDSGPKINTQYQVWATSGSTGIDALFHTDVPQYGELYPGASTYGLRVRSSQLDSFEIIQDKAPNGSAADYLFTIAIEYGIPTFNNRDPNPLDREPDIKWAGGDLVEAMVKDWDDTALKNSAGEMYDPLPERYIQSGDCVITINESTNPASRVVNYSRTTNTAIIWGVAVESALMGKIESQNIIEVIDGAEFSYWRTSYPISFRNDNWKYKAIDLGYNSLSGGNLIPFKDNEGNLLSTPKLLNGSGAVSTTPVVYPTAGFRQYKRTNWATLGLPNPFL